METNEELTSRFEEEYSESAKEKQKDTSITARVYDFAAYVTDTNRIAKVPTGYPNIDAALNGGLSARLYVVGGETSTGKTTFVWNICENIARTGSREVLFFSLEMSAYELIARSVSRRSFDAANSQGVTADIYPLTEDEVLYSLPKVSPKRYNLYAEALEEIRTKEGQHLHIIEGSRDIDQIAAYVMRWIKEHPGEQPPLCVIDYLQILPPTPDRVYTTDVPPEEGQYTKTTDEETGIVHYHTKVTGTERKTPREQIDYNTKTLMFIKREFHTPIIVISAFNRQSSGSLETDMTALKESGSIEYSADCVMLLKYRFTDKEIAGIYDSKRTNQNNKPKEAGQFERELNIKNLLREKAKEYPRNMEILLPKNRGGQRGIDTGLQYFAAYNAYRSAPVRTPPASSADDAREAWKKHKSEENVKK